ncbi:hypothetical protein FOL47_002235 [Perkinsus chesapeaki]|uniref:subtilisin n=1 Tax=Perkinsus chesapeaki TaxID=330153 RepID=A0A7J6N149_PERCH|nr:hypothetical protein FOL47_002235 [Perkinsus chesapeaki]
MQIVSTPTNEVDADTLCGFLSMATKLLPDISAECTRSAVSELTGGRRRKCECDLNVNDPGACTQCQLERVHMREVWQTAEQYPLRNVSVANIDAGVDFTDPGLAPSRLLERALSEVVREGIIVISAAGNFGENSSDVLPCGYNSSNAVCVAALSNSDKYILREDSNFGSHIDIAALGTDVQVGLNSEGRAETANGTSYAAPFVTGTAGILLGLGIKPAEIKSLHAFRFSSR